MIPDEWPHSHHEALQHFYAQYDEAIRSGRFQPCIYPWASFGVLIVLIYLLIPHQKRPWLRNARFLIFACIAAFEAYTIMYNRARNMAPALGLGIVSAWFVCWTFAILVANDAQTDFQRIERLEGVFWMSEDRRPSSSGALGSVLNKETEYNGATNKRIDKSFTDHGEHLGPNERHGQFAWQPYPLNPFRERIDWVLDILCTFRGMGWNWRISSLPPPPKSRQEQLRGNTPNPPDHSFKIHAGQAHIYDTRHELLVANAKAFAIAYLILDALKTFMNHDPYFWGYVERPPPPYFHEFILGRPVLIRIYRLTTSMLLIKHSLLAVFSLAPLFFSGVLSPRLIGARGEVWMHPDIWGSYTVVLDRGLAGWWANWWHQTFRFAFEAPTRKILKITRANPKSPRSKALQLLIAFSMSGFVHACGSYTQPGPSRPIRGPIRFFLLQAIGIFVETYLTAYLRKTGVQHQIPGWMMRIFTFTYVHIWFYHTAYFLCDDFARGGIWLYEPVPFSLFRGLGLGVEGDQIWNWGGVWVRWAKGKHWWTSGIAF